MKYLASFIVAGSTLLGSLTGRAVGFPAEEHVAKWDNTLMAYEEDIKSRSFWDWIKAHTSFFRPLHRYAGVLELDDDSIIFDGMDLRQGVGFHLEIPVDDITDVYLGWDDVFTGFPLSRAGDRAYPWNKPLRLRYRANQAEKTIYLFVRFHRKWGIRASDNRAVYEILTKHLER
jgi:hypothetical protein